MEKCVKTNLIIFLLNKMLICFSASQKLIQTKEISRIIKLYFIKNTRQQLFNKTKKKNNKKYKNPTISL